MDLNVASVGVTLGPQGRLPKQEPTLACGLTFAGASGTGAVTVVANAGVTVVNCRDKGLQLLIDLSRLPGIGLDKRTGIVVVGRRHTALGVGQLCG